MKGLRKTAVMLALSTLLVPALLGAEDSPVLPVKISPDHKLLRYTGRFDKSSGMPRCAWSGSSIQAGFYGSAVNVLLRDSASGTKNRVDGYNSNYLNIIIDNREPQVLVLEKDRTIYRVAEGLPGGDHTITIFKRTEAGEGIVTFMGLQLAVGGRLNPLPSRPERRIEFIGDSITCGYGNEAAHRNMPYSPSTENNYIACGAVTARNLGAEYVCIAWSGIGIYRDNRNNTKNTMPSRYSYVLPWDTKHVWDFKSWVPHVVVINLCTNDFKRGIPDEKPFVDAYRGFVQVIRRNYPDAHIFCAVGSMMDGKKLAAVRGYINRLIRSLNDSSVHYVEFEPQKERDGYGADWHPSAGTHQIMADVLTEAIRQKLKWY